MGWSAIGAEQDNSQIGQQDDDGMVATPRRRRRLRLASWALAAAVLFLAGLYAASPQLIRWWASLLAERLGVTLVTLEAGRPGLHGIRLPHLEAAAGQAHVVVDDALLSYDLRGLLAGRPDALQIGAATLTLAAEADAAPGSAALSGPDADAFALAGWTDRVPVDRLVIEALEIRAPHAGFAAGGMLHYGADGLTLALAGREPEAASRLDLEMALSPAGVVQARFADREAPDPPVLSVVSSLGADGLSVKGEVALSGYPLQLVAEMAGLPPGDGALRGSVAGRLPWPLPDAGLWQAATVAGPMGLEWASTDGRFRVENLDGLLDLRDGVMELRVAGRLQLRQGEITALAEMPDDYLLRFDGTRLEGGPGLELSAAAGGASGPATGTATGTGRLTSFVLTPGPEPSLRAAGEIVASADGSQAQGALRLEARRTAAETFEAKVEFTGSARVQRVEADGTLEADVVLAASRLQISGDADTESLGRMTFDGHYGLDGGDGGATVEGAMSLAGPLLKRALREWREPWDLDGGRLGYTLNLSWQDLADVGVRARVSLLDVSAHYASVTARGGDGEFVVRREGSSWVIDETPVTIASVDFGVSASDISAFVAWNGAELQVRGATAALLGGGVTAAPFSYYPATGYGAIDLRLVELSLADLLALEGDDISGTGRLNGTLPIRLLGNAASVEGGRVRAAAPGGTLRVSEDFRVPSGQPGLDFALRALHNFDYSQLEADVDYAENGDLQLAVRLRGRNPEVESGRPIHYNLNINENVPMLLKSLRLQDRVTREVERRVRN